MRKAHIHKTHTQDTYTWDCRKRAQAHHQYTRNTKSHKKIIALATFKSFHNCIAIRIDQIFFLYLQRFVCKSIEIARSNTYVCSNKYQSYTPNRQIDCRHTLTKSLGWNGRISIVRLAMLQMVLNKEPAKSTKTISMGSILTLPDSSTRFFLETKNVEQENVNTTRHQNRGKPEKIPNTNESIHYTQYKIFHKMVNTIHVSSHARPMLL